MSLQQPLPPNPDDWPEDERYRFYERWNIAEFDGGMATDAARALAEAEVRRDVEGPEQMQLGVG